MSVDLDSSLQYLKGVGEKRFNSYSKLRLSTIGGLLNHFPRRYIDLSSPYDIAAAPYGEVAAVRAVLVSRSSEQRIRKGLSIFKLVAVDATGDLEITIFNAKYLVSGLEVDSEYIFLGRVEGGITKRKMSSPEIYPTSLDENILPVYPQTAGITSGLMRQNIRQILSEISHLTDPIPHYYREKYNLEEINACYRNIHFPETMEAAEIARKRFIFEELLTLVCSLFFIKSSNRKNFSLPAKSVDLDKFYSSLPYKPTGAQLRCIKEATTDMLGGETMNRLIQGDVGSGKTLVAAACVYFAYKNGMQSVIMVPTEILAEQHYNTLLEQLSPFGINIALLTGSTKAKQKRDILAGLISGDINFCVGTHALLSDNIVYNNLGLVITDEQHRFGVEQRAILSDKSKSAHLLVMSATPIPRTLSLIIYGDLSLSVLDEMPAGRQKIDTLLINSSKLKRAYSFIKKQIGSGRQAYFVFPLIETGETETNLKPATEYFEYLSAGEFSGYKLGLLHGKMPAKQKEETMRLFKENQIQLLVSTTVIEVGVDVPNATIMMIHNAERFGLSQIHQLRGRVGRGKDKSYCILVSDSTTETATKRLSAAKELSDGFKLAEYDLKLRGPGDFLGFRQHGLPALKIADLADNMVVVEDVKDCANEILLEDNQLVSDKYSILKQNVEKMINNVGTKPN